MSISGIPVGGPGPVIGGGTLDPSKWSSPRPATADIQNICDGVRGLVESAYNGNKPFHDFTATSYISRDTDDGLLVRAKVCINPLAQIRLQVKRRGSAPHFEAAEAFCDGNLQEGPQ
ncbi:uncharacterized protein LOC135822772 [Sycon ciliatum]|uniref:uncharacterized protein LOC135822772 n=1 Tax=Sycon ciliatum TaxID=27933 RepID=UPI0020ADFF58|eukprot:scpid101251/ scgid11933/ 